MAKTKGQRGLIRALAAKRRRRKEAGSKTVKPTAAEQKLVDAELRRKYPQMFEPPAGHTKMMRGMSTVERKKLMRRLGEEGLRKIRESYVLKKPYKD